MRTRSLAGWPIPSPGFLVVVVKNKNKSQITHLFRNAGGMSTTTIARNKLARKISPFFTLALRGNENINPPPPPREGGGSQPSRKQPQRPCWLRRLGVWTTDFSRIPCDVDGYLFSSPLLCKYLRRRCVQATREIIISQPLGGNARVLPEGE